MHIYSHAVVTSAAATGICAQTSTVLPSLPALLALRQHEITRL
jgi:hypothetical protein